MDSSDNNHEAGQQGLQVENEIVGNPSSKPAAETSVPTTAVAVSNPATSGLQQFLPGLEIATEEDYIQGLSDRERERQAESVQWLTFALGDEEYALSLDVVLELIKPRSYTILPHAPDYVCGILSLRGVVLPVIDLMQRLQLGRSSESSLQRIVVCEGEEQPVGLLVDRVTQVIRIPKKAIEQAPLSLKGRGSFVSGLGRYQGRMLILLNPDEVLQICT